MTMPEDMYTSIVEWLELANGGCKGSQYNIGMACKIGFPGFPRSRKQAFYWFDIAAKNGSHDAMYELIECYSNGYGVKKNEYMANLWENRLENSHSTLARSL
jgi:TPR repeat protein